MSDHSNTSVTTSVREYRRRGPDHRLLLGGVIPDFLTIRQWFDFQGVAIGRWVTVAEQERAAGYFYDALSDLVQILAGRRLQPTEQIYLGRVLISLRGSLGLKYGTGGRPGAAAHYEPARRTFALAKNAGPGSIAHEWFHAFDHFIADKAFARESDLSLASSLWSSQPMLEHPLNRLLSDCYRTVLLAPDGKASELAQRSQMVDQVMGSFYFSRPEELVARSFEAFIQDSSIHNEFLVKGTRQSEDARMGLYPKDEQRSKINSAFQSYFSSLSSELLQRAG